MANFWLSNICVCLYLSVSESVFLSIFISEWECGVSLYLALSENVLSVSESVFLFLFVSEWECGMCLYLSVTESVFVFVSEWECGVCLYLSVSENVFVFVNEWECGVCMHRCGIICIGRWEMSLSRLKVGRPSGLLVLFVCFAGSKCSLTDICNCQKIHWFASGKIQNTSAKKLKVMQRGEEERSKRGNYIVCLPGARTISKNTNAIINTGTKQS